MKIAHKAKEEKLKVFAQSNGRVEIDALNLRFQELNAMVKSAAQEGAQEISLYNIYGQRYIGTGVHGPVHIEIKGIPGNDLGAFMDGPQIVVRSNAQDGVGNTMNGGSIVVHGRAGDIVAMGMRGGKIFIRDSVGYRAAIHMKEYRNHKPVLLIGETAQDFLGEYMAGGIVIVLGLGKRKPLLHTAKHIGTGMHGGVIYIRGDVDDHNLGSGVSREPLCEGDRELLHKYVVEFTSYFGGDADKIMQSGFQKLLPKSYRPFEDLYTY